ncbi:membrane protein [Kordiimonas sediminis]|uniref:Membrane protein n=1 Tax=Kordiimonas sediminis TaxID=1735581 RepID=A0A919AXL4_9PROT|nr:DUF1295 domain-containing protein [Kordiimonas sediminis]GHF29980.1 membrane protein [Kordiimonas sediminis]
MIDLALVVAQALVPALLILWCISILTGKVSFIDSFWGAGFALIAATCLLHFGNIGAISLVTAGLTIVWGMRLALYLLKRFLHEGEDKRYIRMTKGKEGLSRHFFTLFMVFGFQGALMFIISAPVMYAFLKADQSLTLLSYVGIALWCAGIFFEWVGDYQLAAFKKNPDNAGKVLNTGLWAWTRHPNYFGDFCVWWGLWMISHHPVTIVAPIIMSILLMKVSGTPLLEKSLKYSRPGYDDYIRNTSEFFPRPPKGT